MLSQGLAGRRKKNILWPKYLGHFFFNCLISQWLSLIMTHQAFSINVVLASHQSKCSYALLLVHIYIYNVLFLNFVSIFGISSLHSFSDSILFVSLFLTWSLPVLFLTEIPGLATSVKILKTLVQQQSGKALRCSLMLEVAMEGVFEILLTQAPSQCSRVKTISLC